MSDAPLMPKATAVWLVDNTALTFSQIGDFCKLHPLEVKGIADGEVAVGIKGMDPIAANQITRDEISAGEKDASHKLQLAKSKIEVPVAAKRKGPKYTPVSRRQDRPDAISWLLRYHPELVDSQVMKLVGTTKTTINAIRDRTHWNSQNLKPVDPVTLGLCSQLELDLAVRKAAKRVEKAGGTLPNRTLMPAEETVPPPIRDCRHTGSPGRRGHQCAKRRRSLQGLQAGRRRTTGRRRSRCGRRFSVRQAEGPEAPKHLRKNRPPLSGLLWWLRNRHIKASHC